MSNFVNEVLMSINHIQESRVMKTLESYSTFSQSYNSAGRNFQEKSFRENGSKRIFKKNTLGQRITFYQTARWCSQIKHSDLGQDFGDVFKLWTNKFFKHDQSHSKSIWNMVRFEVLKFCKKFYRIISAVEIPGIFYVHEETLRKYRSTFFTNRFGTEFK